MIEFGIFGEGPKLFDDDEVISLVDTSLKYRPMTSNDLDRHQETFPRGLKDLGPQTHVLYKNILN